MSRAALACVLTLAAAGCGGASRGAARPEGKVGAGHGKRAAAVMVFDARAGGHSSLDGFTSAAAGARAVYVGETHNNADHHAIQLQVIAALWRQDRSLAIGLEMVQRPFQAPLDRWVRGEIGEATLLGEVEWEERWGFDWELYRPIFLFAQTHKIPLVALNARRELTKRIAKVGVEGLTADERAELPELVLDDAAHKAMVKDAMGAHHHGSADASAFERMYAAQVTWDETMAASVAERLAAPNAPKRIVVLAGYNHVLRGLGIPGRAGRRGVTPFLTVLPSDKGDVMDLVGEKAADFVMVVEN